MASYTRVYVSGLGLKTAPEAVRAHFGAAGDVTDVAVPRRRGFAFVGFRTSDAANAAVRKLDRSFLGAHRLRVVPASEKAASASSSKKQNRAQKTTTEKSRRLGAAAHEQNATTKKRARTRPAREEEEDDDDDDSAAAVDETREKKKTKRDRFFELVTGKPRPEPKKKKKPSLTLQEEEAPGATAAAFDDALDDMAYLRTKQPQDGGNNPGDDEDDDRDDGPSRDTEDEAASARLVVKNLAYSTTEDAVAEKFSEFGHVAEVHAPIDRSTKAPLGYAFVRFVLPEAAQNAREALDGTAFEGRVVSVDVARDLTKKPISAAAAAEAHRPRTFSEKRAAERRERAAAGGDRVGARLGSYVREDVAAEVIARRVGGEASSRGAVFSATDTDAAARLALAEAAVQSETEAFFRSHGVDLSSKASSSEEKSQTPSRTAILVKNLAPGTTEAELRRLFCAADVAARVLVAPSGTTALVDFDQPTEARAAFRRSAYRRHKRVPLYLEWAPTIPTGTAAEPTATTTTSSSTQTPSSSLFVKNLAFATPADGLSERFRPCRGFRAVGVPPAKDGKKGNRGYGFVEFDTVEDAAAARDALQGSVLDGHALDLSFCSSGGAAARGDDDDDLDDAKKKPKSTKLVVRNLAFGTHVRDVRSLFGAFGALRTVRLPKRVDGRPRGFAFVEFDDARDAAKAKDGLKAAHLYGRHLVIENADDDGSGTTTTTTTNHGGLGARY